MMKYLTLFSFICCSLLSHAQSISGTIVDSAFNQVPNLELIVFQENGEMAEIGTTDQEGGFAIKLSAPGTYYLKIYELGLPIQTEKVIVTGEEKLNIQLAKTIQFEEIQVRGKRTLLVREIDRLSFNIEHSVMGTGQDALEVLRITPLVLVGEESISIVGKSTVLLLIDDRQLNLDGNDLINYLRSIRSDDIEKIEVITAPPAKYQAEGNSGIINIVLKKNPSIGWSGNIATSYIQTTYAGGAVTSTLNYRTKKFVSTMRLRGYHRSSHASEDIDVVGFYSILALDERKDTYLGAGGNLNISYALTPKINIGGVYDLSWSQDRLTIENYSEYLTNNLHDSTLYTASEHESESLVQTASAYAEITLDSLGKHLSITANHFSNTPNNLILFTTNTLGSNFEQTVTNKSAINYGISSGQLDLRLPYKIAIIESGAKYTFFSNQSDVNYYNLANSTEVIDSARSNIFDYQEHNAAGYICATKRLNAHWNVKAGLRYEYSDITGISKTTGQVTHYSYDSWFPSAYLSFTPSDTHSYYVNYSKRINRPNFNSLNPFRWYSNPYTYYTGNPTLLPSFNHNVEIGYGYLGILNLSLYGQKIVNGYGRTITVNNGIERVVNYANYLTQYDVGLSASAFFSPVELWDIYAVANGSYSEASSSLNEIVVQNGYSVYLSINNTIRFSTKSKIRGLVNYWHLLPSRQSNSFSDNISSLSVGVRFPFAKGKFNASAMINDVLRTSVSRGELYFSDFTQFYNNYYDARSITVNISYNFGKKGVDSNNKEVRFDDQYRGN